MPDEPESGLSPQEQRELRAVAAVMIPADSAFDVPGADDPAIFADIVASLGRDLGMVRTALAALAVASGGAFGALDPAQREDVAISYLARGDSAAITLGRVVLQCYYRDDRVMRALGLEPRAPFPKGHPLQQGDLSLLDPVRARPKLWRDAPRADTAGGA